MITPGRSYNISDYKEIFLRRKLYFVIPFVVIFAAAALWAGLAPRKYQALTLVLVTPQRVPTDLVRPTVTAGILERLNSISQEIMSRTRLEQIIDDNRRAREGEARRAAVIVDAGVDAWLRDRRSLDAAGTLRAYRERAEELRDQELERALRQLRGGADAEQLLGQLARNLTNKLLHEPSVQLRRAAAEGRTELVGWGRRLFGLDDGPDERDK